MPSHAVLTTVADQPGLLFGLTRILASHDANIEHIDIVHEPRREAAIYLEFSCKTPIERIVSEMQDVPGVIRVDMTQSFGKVYGKRIIIMGGGAQVGQVAMGAILEADRHNIRGEHISVDTIPLVGELPLAEAVRAAARLPRVKALVMAGALMGGEITRAVQDVRAQGLMVVSLNMAGSVPEASDLVVSDPVQAGVMTVMAVAETAKFSLAKLKRREF
jgi:energy-converting hydrogenase B subunit Q